MSSLRRADLVLAADPRRVVTKLFLPGQEILATGISRADAVLERILAMSEQQVQDTLQRTLARFAGRHSGLLETFTEHFDLVAHRLMPGVVVSAERRSLIGAYYTQEYAIEAAAFFNPSMVAHPDQSGLADGEVRFVLSARAVGEGHISSVEFRSGTIAADGELRLDPVGTDAQLGRRVPSMMSRQNLSNVLREQGDSLVAEHVLRLLPERFDDDDFNAALVTVRRERLTRSSADAVMGLITTIAYSNYRVQFDAGTALSDRVLYPISSAESHGMEDARFTRFVDDDGSVEYLATYTAYDGRQVSPQLLRTTDFATFDCLRLLGPAARNKGMALFPRRIGGAYFALSRADRESILVATSTDLVEWHAGAVVQSPTRPWQVIQLGNCGPPLETADGWLVFTHGVGPVREYVMSALLLDLADPTVLIGELAVPLLVPSADEREGYVPNVVYSCGGLIHGDTVVLPYGCSDARIRFAFLSLTELLADLRADSVAVPAG
jgi:predicted GH43/DUF377 family glycosyl hydrolase